MKGCFTLFALLLCLTLQAQTDNSAKRIRNFNLTDNGVALRDFDPVSYFKGHPAKGNDSFKYSYKGITYYFADTENQEEFKKTPEKYEPACGGWDAYSMAIDGQRVKIDPSTYKIVDGKLFLFYNFNGSNNRLKWEKDEKKYARAAHDNWLSKQR
jgi:YHS domain-containing protein